MKNSEHVENLIVELLWYKSLAHCPLIFKKWFCDKLIKQNSKARPVSFSLYQWRSLKFICFSQFPQMYADVSNIFVRPKKVVLLSKIGLVKIFLSLTRPQSRMCIRIIIFCCKKNTHTHTQKNKKQDKLKKKREKQMKPKKKRRKKILLF